MNTIENVFSKRAEMLAKRRIVPDTEREAVPMLFFRVGSLRCALPLEEIIEVLPFTACTPVPEAPPELMGAINVRGSIQAVLDLAVLLDQTIDKSTPGYLLLLKKSSALRADSVEEVRRIALEDWQAPGETFSDLKIRFIKGINQESVILLDLAEIIKLEEVSTL